MKKYFCIAIVLVCFSQNAFSHGSHAPTSVSKEAAFAIAEDVAEQFTAEDPGLGFGQLAETWNALPDNAIKMHVRNEAYYIIALKNAQENRTLYILMSAGGEVYDANFTGEFKGLDAQ